MNPSSGASTAASSAGAVAIRVNGVSREFAGVRTLADLLASLELDPAMVVVELNRAIVRRPALADTPVRAGDQVELVHFVGGG